MKNKPTEVKGYDYLTKRQRYNIIEKQLREDRDSFRSYWRDLSRYILPRRSRFFVTDAKRGERRNFDIIDSTATLAARTLSSGMMTGITSPARSWFKLEPSLGQDQAGSAAVKDFFKQVTDNMRSIFLRSNLYNVLPTTYGDMGTFGTGCVYMEEDVDDVVKFYSFPVGSYMIANDEKGRVRVFFREFQMTVRQIIEKFGERDGKGEIQWDNLSQQVKDQYVKGQLESNIVIGHIVLPNDNYRPNSPLSKHKRYKSCYYELGLDKLTTSSQIVTEFPNKFLSEKGYDYFPVLAPRWEVVGEDVYGTNAPGMVCLGDVKQLQFGEKRIASALDQKVRPSMIGPVSLRNQKASILPGDITYLDEREGTKGFRRLFEVDFDIRELEGKQLQIRERVSKAFYEDLFLMLSQSNRAQITAREIEERHEEKLLALGPVLERINQDLLDPLIENTFLIMSNQDILPEIPEEMKGAEYKIEYVSIMAQAQKLAGIGNIERFTRYGAELAQLDPSVLNKIKFDEAIELYGDLTGVPQNIITSKEEMEAIREEQAKAAQAEQQAMAQQQAVDSAKTLSETSMTEDSALKELMGGISEP